MPRLLPVVCFCIFVAGSMVEILAQPADAAQRPRRRRDENLKILPEGTFAATHDYGVGVSIGVNSGLSLLYNINSDRFVQAVVGFGAGRLALSADYGIAHPYSIPDMPSVVPYYGYGLVLVQGSRYFGFGGSAKRDALHVGGRIPFGLQFAIPETPIQLAVELAPGLFLVPATYAFIDAQLMVRVLF